ncbi:IPTL-CTERM sorting domain-containing protein [Ottowia oryzae]
MHSLIRPYAAAALACFCVAAQAATVAPTPSISFTCTHFVTNNAVITADRNTTGTGAEQVTLIVTDGGGNVIASAVSPSIPVGGTNPLFAGTWPYTATPTSNPLVARLVSPAGNALPEQVLFSASGSCASLPTVAVTAVPTLEVWGLSLLALAAAGLGAGRLRKSRIRN